MTLTDIAHARLINQAIAQTKFNTPQEVVSWLGAVQAQDYYGSLWGIGLRLPNAGFQKGNKEADIEHAIAEHKIVRTWSQRGTIHFVSAADLRWIPELLTPRILSATTAQHQREGLDSATYARSRKVFTKALQGGKQLPRPGMYRLLQEADISTKGLRGLFILHRLAQEGLLCFGARAGKQPTFALSEEWVPNTRRLARGDALAEIAKRYFTGHGPATLQDFVWWTGLKVADARAGLEMVKAELEQIVVEDKTYWTAEMPTARGTNASGAYLLPAYDEYLVGYQDRRAAIDPEYEKHFTFWNGSVFNPTIIIGGKIIGTWKRLLNKNAPVNTTLFISLSQAKTRAVNAAANRYQKFLNS